MIKTKIENTGISIEEVLENPELVINIPTIINGTNITETINIMMDGVENISELSSIDDTRYKKGIHIWVETLKDHFYLNEGTLQTPDGITVINSLSGVNQWIRKEQSNLVWKNQTEWFIDPIFGHDEYNGSNSIHAIKTWAELFRRVTNGFTWNVSKKIRVDIINDLPVSDPLVGHINIQNGARLVINGQKVSQFSGSVTSKTDLDGPSSTLNTIASAWTVSTELKKLIKDVTNNRYAWVYKDLGSGQAVIAGPWAAVDEINGSQVPALGNTVIGANIETYKLVKINKLQLLISGTAGGTSPFCLENFEVTSTGGTARFVSLNSQPTFQNIDLNAAIRFGGGVCNIVNCQFRQGNNAIDIPTYLRIRAGVSLGAWNTSAQTANTYELREHHHITTSKFTVFGGSVVRIYDAWLVDQPNDGIYTNVNNQVHFNFGSLNGNNVSGSAIALSGGSVCCYDATHQFNINANGGDFTFQGNSTARAFDNISGTYTEPRNLSFENIKTSVVSGGFGGSVNDPVTGCKICPE